MHSTEEGWVYYFLLQLQTAAKISLGWVWDKEHGDDEV